MSSARIDTEKFNGAIDYNLWKEKLLANLEILGLTDALRAEEEDVMRQTSGSLRGEDPKGKAVGDEGLKQIESDRVTVEKQRKVRSIIILSLTDQILRKVIKEETASGMLKALDSLFMSQSLPNRIYLKQRLYGFKMNESLSVENNLDEFLKIITDLGNVKVDITDEDQAILLLMSLPKQFDQLRDTMRYGKAHLTLEEVIGAVQSKQLEFTSSGKPIKSQGEGLFTSLSDKGKVSKENLKSKKKFKGKPKANVVKKFVCWTCGGEGHLRRNCPKKKDFENGESAAVMERETVEALMVSESNLSVDLDFGEAWILDTGCTFHMTPRRDWFEEIREFDAGTVRMANESISEVRGVGSVKVQTSDGRLVLISEVRYVPTFTRNLLSLGTFESNGCVFKSENGLMEVCKNNRTVLKGRRRGSLYYLDGQTYLGEVNSVVIPDETELWHRRLGHIGQRSLTELAKKGYLKSGKISKLGLCESCVYGKTHKLSFTPGKHRTNSCLEYIHADLWGSPNVPASLSGCHYFLSLIDDKSRKVWTYFLKTKDQAFEKFVEWKGMVEKQSGLKVKTLRTDNGLEFCNQEFDGFCLENGIRRHRTIAYTPQQNGVAERMNRTILDKVRCMLSESGLQKRFWAEAVNTAVYLINRSPSSALNFKVPEEVWSGNLPEYEHLRVFGSICYYHTNDGKLQPRAKKGVFLGYPPGVKGYKVWSVDDQQSILSRNVRFNEGETYRDVVSDKLRGKEALTEYTEFSVDLGRSEGEEHLRSDEVISSDDDGAEQEGSAGDMNSDESGDSDDGLGDYQLARDRVRREVKPPKRYSESNVVHLALSVSEDGNQVEPVSYQMAIHDTHKDEWIEAMKEEMRSLYKNNTWKLVCRPQNRRLVGCKWIYTRKSGIPGVEKARFKARLVAKGYSQKEGLDYTEIFSPVVKLVSVRYLMAVVVQEDLELEQLDVKTAFLHGELEEEIYMSQPEGFVESGKEEYVCLLQKSLYGLKQSPRQWNQRFNLFMTEIGFRRSIHDSCVYIKRFSDCYLYLLLYVDDMLVACKDMKLINILKQKLSEEFEMKDLGSAKKILGIEISRNRTEGILTLSQETYLKKVVRTFGMHESKVVHTPLGMHIKLSAASSDQLEKEAESMENVPYSNAVGSLMYGMMGTRPDLAYPVGMVSRYMSQPVKQHWEAVKWILRYLKGAAETKLVYRRCGSLEISGYCDSDYAADLDKRRSISGYAFQAGVNLISWRSTLQKVIALSTTEAEFMALTAAAKESIWLKGLSEEFGYHQKNVNIKCDSQSALALTKNHVYHDRSKHMAVKMEFVRELVSDGEVVVSKVNTTDNAADVFTKVLPVSRFKMLLNLLGVSA